MTQRDELMLLLFQVFWDTKQCCWVRDSLTFPMNVDNHSPDNMREPESTSKL
jgi:hypothetical protein